MVPALWNTLLTLLAAASRSLSGKANGSGLIGWVYLCLLVRGRSRLLGLMPGDTLRPAGIASYDRVYFASASLVYKRSCCSGVRQYRLFCVSGSGIKFYTLVRVYTFWRRCRESALDLNDMMTREYCTPMVKSDYTMCILETVKALEIVLIYTCTSQPSPRLPGMLPHSGNQRPPGTERRIRHRRDFARRTRSDRESKVEIIGAEEKETV